MNFNSSSRHLKTLAYLFYTIVALIAFWYWHVDEHYQITEFASYKLGNTPAENLAWEFHSHMRSAILPFIVYCISKLSLLVSCFHPYFPGAISRVMSALLFIYVYLRFIDYLQIDKKSKYYKIAIFFWILPTVMVRFSPESVSGSLFLLGFLIMEVTNKKNKNLTYFCVGILWGLAFYIRMHIAVLIGVYLLYQLIWRRLNLRILVCIFAGFILSTMVEVFLNLWLYGQFIWSPYYYFIENVMNDKASDFGIMPWYFYLTETSKNLFYPIGIVLWFGIVYYTYKNPKSILTWLFWSFLITHSIIGHKEYRFLFPIFPIFILMFIKSIESISETKLKAISLKLFLAINIILLPSCFLIQSFKPLNWFQLYSLSKKYETIYTDYPSPFALDTRFHKVRPYFWKHPSCKIIDLSKKEWAKNNNVNLFITTKDLGNNIIINECILEKNYQTIPSFINDKLPIKIKESIDYLYVYRRL